MSSQGANKPLLLFTSFPSEGHTNPVLAIAKYMVSHGYPVVYLAAHVHRDKICAMGAEFIAYDWTPMSPRLTSGPLPTSMVKRLSRASLQLVELFYDTLPGRFESLSAALEMLRRREPGRQIIVVEDILNMTTMPYRYGSALPAGFEERPATVGISSAAAMLQSQDTAPFYVGLPPDPTPAGRLRNSALHDLVFEGPMTSVVDAWNEALRICGCNVSPRGSPFSGWFNAYDVTMMLCSPSLEYPMSDLPSHVKFVGCLPRRGVDDNTAYPKWWSDVVQAAAPKKKKVVFVSQGTINHDVHQLIVPTLAALAGREDLLVVATMGDRDARVEAVPVLPPNARVANYIPYDAVLPYTDVFVSNAGYGAFTHAVMNGVPAVFAGTTEDKIEVAMRAEWAGFACNLGTQTPSQAQISEAVDMVFANDRFKARALQLKTENEHMDALARIEKHIVALTV
ncbi:UDP-glucuronosyl/UDP-glucosyltransferase [Moelleriella libera RCEF 2490]|uniref:UDP-glucuronosyl/UDP-glucosyltransferase n=1 Tax=Moelleriella libera RCEF 2490 TaxID=1081109 RepID=A0A167YA74_9HYPO|nr:UDP-glucuronosyl/UDP-glucosyltransferase [Moelleriella libera RCEF 2490]